MVKLDRLQNYKDDLNNIIEYDGASELPVNIVIKGSGNRIKIHKDFKLTRLSISADCNNAYLEIGKCGFMGGVKLGEDAKIIIKDNVSCTNNCTITSMEGATVFIGEDCMIASNNIIRSDDAHPIFDVNTGERLNMSQDVYIGNHVWLAYGAVVLSGSKIGDGSVVGLGSVVKGTFPNNCIIAGVPAKIIKKDIAWERPHLSSTKPYYKPHSSCITKSRYWKRTIN